MAATGVQSAPNALPDLGMRSIYEGKFTDRNPDIRSAGKFTATSDSAVLCLKPPDKRPPSPDVVRRFRNFNRSDAGKATVFYGRAQDPHRQWAKQMTHGVSTQPSLVSGDLVNPPPKSLYQQRTLDKKESIYLSKTKAPLGVTHDQRPGFPEGFNFYDRTFGIHTRKDGTAGELVNPDKPREVVERESESGRDLYRQTHFDYKVGEQCNRRYLSPAYTPSSKFGRPTPHENNGRQVKRTLKWVTDDLSEKRAPIVSQRVDAFRERTQPQLGKVHDPIKDTLNVAPDHTFGILLKPDEYGAGDLMHGRSPSGYLRGKDRQRGVIAAIRQHLKKANYHNFQDLLAAFRYYDKNGKGRIDINDLREACLQFNLPAEPELLEQLIAYCSSDPTLSGIDYVEFCNFLNWKDKMPSGIPGSDCEPTPKTPVEQTPAPREPTPGSVQKQIDSAIGGHRTSAQMINAVVGGVSTRDFRKYGVPTIRTDLPAPRIRRICDRTNYGDESDAFGLVNPSVYSTHGVYEKDFLRPRTKAEVKAIFANIGLQIDHDTFDQFYEMAASQHPSGQVSVESFRNILDLAQTTALAHSRSAMV